MLEPPFTDEALEPSFDLLAHRRIEHVVVIGSDFLMDALGRIGQQIAVLVDGERWAGTPHPHSDRGSSPGRQQR